MKDTILNINDLHFSFKTHFGEIQAVRGVSLEIERGETLGIVGESGCGKSVTARSIIKLHPGTNGIYKNGSIDFNGQDILKMSQKEVLKLRAEKIRMVFQDPMTSLNPTMRVGQQIMEGILEAHPKMPKSEAKEIALQSLRDTGIPNAEERFKQFPHQFSGGMRQRVMIALAMAVTPELLICDEPTTALDVTLQAQILDLIKELQKKQNTTIILITHDLGVVANSADHVAVMYAGKVVEYGTTKEIFYNGLHPYTWGVLHSVPPIDVDSSVPLSPIPGTPPDLFNPPVGCSFAARCPHAMEVCRTMQPPSFLSGEAHTVSCWLYHENAPKINNPITNKEVCL